MEVTLLIAGATGFQLRGQIIHLLDINGAIPGSAPLASGSLWSCPSGWLNAYQPSMLNGNGVIHFNVNGAGDFWVTSTYTGAISVSPALSVVLDSNRNVTSFVPDPSRPSASGRVTDWFGFEQNRSNAVGSNTVDARVTTTAEQGVGFHLNGHSQFSATGVLIRMFTDFHCV